MRRLSPFERRLLTRRGIPAAHVAAAERTTVARVLAAWEDLRARGHLPSLVERDPREQQLDLGDIDQLMREPPSP